MVNKTLGFLLATVCATSVFAEQGRGGGQRPPLTPEQQAEEARRRADTAKAEGVRPIEMLDSVWIEELSWIRCLRCLRCLGA